MSGEKERGAFGGPEGGLDALVVGTGQAGLAAGYHLSRVGLSFAILESADKPGGFGPVFGGKRRCGVGVP